MFGPLFSCFACLTNRIVSPFCLFVCVRVICVQLVPEYEVARENREALKNYIHIARNLKTQKSIEFLKQVIDDESLEHFT